MDDKVMAPQFGSSNQTSQITNHALKIVNSRQKRDTSVSHNYGIKYLAKTEHFRSIVYMKIF